MSQPTPSSPQQKQASPRNRRKVEIGMVTSDKMNKTRRVEVERLVPHPKYGKYLNRRTVCHAHDEENQSHVGDLVEIMETRPLSKLKRWRIVRIVRKGAQLALAGEGETAAQLRARAQAEIERVETEGHGETPAEDPSQG
ncbi:30S ribosomal protein S17 [soil metagenome]